MLSPAHNDVLEDRCVGCTVCTIACPFGTVNYNQSTVKVIECDLCGGDPECTKAFRTAAISYLDEDQTGHDLCGSGLQRAWPVGRGELLSCGGVPRPAPGRRALRHGTLMVSRNLKVESVRGTVRSGNINDPKRFMDAVNAGKKVLAENAVTGQGLATYGTQVLTNVINEIGALPTRNMHEVQFEGAGDVCPGFDISTGEFGVQGIQPTVVEHGRIAAYNMPGITVYRTREI